MPTIAELQVKVDSTQLKDGKQAFNEFADSAKNASDAVNKFKGGSAGGGIAPEAETSKVKNLSASIDDQTRKLQNLATQRKALEASGMKTTDINEYTRLNSIIDANIALVERQGTAVSRLTSLEDKDLQKKTQKAEQEARIQENIVKATERKDLVITNASAREQRSIEQTINGLDRQIKAQNDYNKAIQNLSKARALSGMSGPDDSRTTMSGAEFDSYTKLAAAQRDAKLAVMDYSAEMDRVRSKLDTYTATLSRTDRAEVEHKRSIEVLNEARRLGIVTQDEYDAKLARFNERLESVKKGNEGAAISTERLSKQMNQVTGRYDAVTKAMNNQTVAEQILTQANERGLISTEDMTKALQGYSAAVEKAKAKVAGPDIGEEFERGLDDVLAYRTELRNLELQEKRLQDMRSSGRELTDTQQRDLDRATTALQKNREALEKRIRTGENAGMTYKQEQAALRGMPAQITDIVVSLQGGQAPLTVLLQQGGQIKDMFGGVGAAIRGMATTLVGMINPFTVAAAVMGTLAIAAYQGGNELNEFNKALIQTRGVSGASANDFTAMRTELDGITGTASQAAQALTLMESSGKIASGSFVEIGEAAILMQKATGQAMSETIEDFASLGKDPVDAAIRLDEKYKFLTGSVIAQAAALEEQGRKQEAVTLLQGRMAEAATEAAKTMIEEAGWIEQAWNGVKGAVSDTWDALRGIGRESTAQSELDEVLAKQKEIYDLARGNEAALKRNSKYQELEAERRVLQARVDTEKSLADYQAKREIDRQKDVAYTNQMANASLSNLATLDKVQAKEEALKKVQREQAEQRERVKRLGRDLSADEVRNMDRALAAAKQELKDAQEAQAKKGGRGAIDTRELTEVKSNLKNITAEYDGYYKNITALGKANVVNAEATYRSQMAVLQAQEKAVSDSFGKTISELERLRGAKGNTAAQNISLDNQMTKAEDERVRAVEAIQNKQEQLTIAFQGDMEKRRASIDSYTDAIKEQVRALREQGDRAVAGVGMGSRQSGVANQQYDNDLWYAKEKRRLSEALTANKIDDNEYKEKYATLKAAHSEMTDVIIENDRKVQEANADWTNGFTASIQNAQDAGMNFAGNMQTALTGAFTSAGQAFATFVTTGKLSFQDLTLSIISNMAQIAAQQAAMGALGALFGAIGGGIGGGGNGLAVGSAGYTSSNLGASAAGYSSKYFAKGGAFTGGTQYFANGGAFTNGIVSSATSFGMANGNRGVMGEAGPEAVVPLTRTSNGDLGVRMVGNDGSGGNTNIVNVVVNVSDDGTQTSTDGGGDWNSFGSQLGQFVDQRVYTIINKETRGGGSLQPQKQ
ncbi:tape measure protein [Pseudomonas phage phiPMW]|uniref:Tape measure protein n=1 Tax=Pseudomonas phage phiPMW TaxID=1815582 RepID=A0A1S5R1G8_9CAUD|nr:tail length tape measure protein [Pseudomonas phage phiPMW]ANA49263.1 tape measure protein [Pseudomonas phage phiPMW]